jgi:hypothetical protein
VDTTSRLIWFFEHFNPHFQCADAVVLVLCSGLCFWSVARQFSAGVLLLGIGCVVSLVQTTCFIISAFQESQPFLPFLPFLPFEFRKEAYLYGRLLGPPQLVLFLVTVILLAFENMRRKRPNQALQPTAGQGDDRI